MGNYIDPRFIGSEDERGHPENERDFQRHLAAEQKKLQEELRPRRKVVETIERRTTYFVPIETVMGQLRDLWSDPLAADPIPENAVLRIVTSGHPYEFVTGIEASWEETVTTERGK